MTDGWTGRRIVLTGASNGIGAALVPMLAPGNELLLAWHRDHDGAVRVRDAALAAGARGVALHQADLARAGEVTNLCAACADAPIDDLILNAGTLVRARFDEADPDDIARQLTVNLVAPILMVRSLIARLRRQVVLVGSDLAREPAPHLAPYCASKFGLRGFARALALDVPRLAVVLLNPDRTATRMNDHQGRDVHHVAAAMARAIRESRAPGFHEVDVWEELEKREARGERPEP